MTPHLSDEELVAKRVQWFEFYTSQRNMAAPEAGGPYFAYPGGPDVLTEVSLPRA
jgi:hypothetical protein